jgi:hypothetical protein
MSPDDKCRWCVVVGDAIIKDYNIKEKTIWHIEYLEGGGRFPYRGMITCGKINLGFALEEKFTLKEFEKKFDLIISDVKKKQTGTGSSLFSL